MSDNWQPIETSPKDGSRFLVYVKGYGPFTAHYCEEICVMTGIPLKADPTHWMPLPKPPNVSKDGRD